MTTARDDTYAWLALYLISGLGIAAFRNLVGAFGTPSAALGADFKSLAGVKGVREDIARRIVDREFTADPEKELWKAEQLRARILTYKDAGYPGLLREIHSAPVLLYVMGKDLPLDRTFVGVVGSRNPTPYGHHAAGKIAFSLARRAIGVVSGLARGVDAAAHRGCMKGEGFTVAVLGTGVDRVYPPENRELRDQIAENGTVLSEFPLGSPPEPRNFPIRNRIISGLSRGVVVVEATDRSGSLITASFALNQGREVFAVPGSIESAKSRGAHLLIKQGAKLVESVEDILEELSGGTSFPERHGPFDPDGETASDLDDEERRVYGAVGNYPVHIDEIVRLSGMGAGKVSGVLMKLELRGIVKQLPGKLFVI